jgi:hypothetical protein
MNQNMNLIGLKRLGVFVTADALLAAILLVWAQLRVHPSIELFIKLHTGEQVANWSNYNLAAVIGLLLTYPAVFLALLALAWAGWRSIEKSTDNTPPFAIGLFGASIAMAIINVAASVLSILMKLANIRQSSIYTPLNLCAVPGWFWIVTGIWALLTVVATGLLFAFSPTCGKWYKIVYILLWVVGLLLFVFSYFMFFK